MYKLIRIALATAATAVALNPISRGVGTFSKFLINDQSFQEESCKKLRNVFQMPPISDHPNSIDVILPENDHRWNTNEELYCRIYEHPELSEKPGHPLLFWIHGGGWAIGSVYNDDAIATKLQQLTNFTVISISYGLAPENPYPQALDDVIDTIELILGSYKKIPPITLAGESAGAHLCLGAYYKLKQRKRIVKMALVYPPITPTFKAYHSLGDHANLNGLLTANSLNKIYKNYIPANLSITTLKPLFPMNYVNVLDKCSILIINARYDILYDENLKFSEKLKERSKHSRHARSRVVTIKTYNDIHGFFGRFGHGNDALTMLGNWIVHN